MEVLSQIQGYALLALGVVMLGVEIFALVEAARGSAVMYQVHGKLTKPAWLAITAVAVLLGVVSLLSPVSLPGIIGIVAAGVFLADVRPLVRPGKPNSNGPYGPW